MTSSARQTTLVHEQSEFTAARAAEKAACAKQNALATHTVAGHALDAADCKYLLEMLGLDAASQAAAQE
ncbi:hypothetical protein LTV02_04205 [Nocardia yamanashiensis]|uniref:hypothetical protein n=1 Tax=Nocardia yamanashiensis TaxID=209247 RepID=UPI0008325EAB|nr:hypothetical protein [Nocardia yamanashiensis]UGT42629.1 hypothetical protein LTV02_04205 [Nocardia yamanashiensis]